MVFWFVTSCSLLGGYCLQNCTINIFTAVLASDLRNIFIRKFVWFQEYVVKISLINCLPWKHKRNTRLNEKVLLKICFLVTILCTVFLAMYLRRNIFVTHGKELNLNIGRMCTDYFNGLFEKKKKNKKSGKIYYSVTL
jgi:hypothetical protein